jgi:DivIVA domain-containing protein
VALTPDEVETKEFVRVLRGYDPAEVATFLRVVAAEMRRRDQVIEAVEGVASGPLADDVVALLKTAYEAAQSRTRPGPRSAPRAGKPRVAAADKDSAAGARRARPLRTERPLRANKPAAAGG